MTPPDSPTKARLKHRAKVLWQADRASLVLTRPFMAQLALNLDLVPVIDRRLATACTDGRSVFVNALFLLGLSDADRRFVLAHEVWHCALGHFARRGAREVRRWNVAVDHEVNALIRGDDGHVPVDSVYIARWDGLCAEEVYARLPENHPALSSRGGLADRHDIAPPSGDEGDPDFRPTPDGFTDWPDKTLAAARAVEGTGGRLPKGAALIIDRLARPRLSWRDMLRRFVASTRRSDRAWHRPNRRLAAQGLCLPGGVRFAPRLVLAIDASGSCVAHLAGFLAELRATLSSVGSDAVRVLVFDAAVHTDVLLASADAVDALAIHGGGGTDFRPVMDRLMASDPPDGLVILTDGLGRAPSTPPPFPILWVLTPLGRTPAPWAQCVPLPPPP